MTRQLALPLPVHAARGRGDFFEAASNAAALAAVEGWRGWPAGRCLIAGPAGAGKSHLVEVWRALLPGAARTEAAALDPAAVPGLVAAGAVAVEDAEAVAGHPRRQTALFHLMNLAAEAGAPLLLTARTPPGGWGVTLPDLESRLAATTLARIEPPCEALVAAVLVKLFADRQLAVGPALVGFLARHLERSLAAVAAAVDRLDRAALERGQRLSRSLALDVLDLRAAPREDGAA